MWAVREDGWIDGKHVAAVRLGVSLPPEGRIERKRRAKRPFPGGFKGPQGQRVWQPEELALLGTMPDAEVARRLPHRTRVSVRRLRRLLKVPLIKARDWDGTVKPGTVSPEEVVARYQCHLQGEPV